MKKKILPLVLIIIGFTAGATALSTLAAWTAPTCTPPNCNADAPVNVGLSLQEKLGPLTVNSAIPQSLIGLTVFGGLKIPDGKGVGKVLTSDADGVGTWQTPASGGGTGTSVVVCTKTVSVNTNLVTATFTSSDCGGTTLDSGYKGAIRSIHDTVGNNAQKLTTFKVLDPGETNGPGVIFFSDTSGALLTEVSVLYTKSASGGSAVTPVFGNGTVGTYENINIGSDWDEVNISGNYHGHIYKSGSQVIAALNSGNALAQGVLMQNQQYCAAQLVGGSPRICVTLASNGDLTIYSSNPVIYSKVSF